MRFSARFIARDTRIALKDFIKSLLGICQKKENAVGGNTKEKARDDFASLEKYIYERQTDIIFSPYGKGDFSQQENYDKAHIQAAL